MKRILPALLTALLLVPALLIDLRPAQASGLCNNASPHGPGTILGAAVGGLLGHRAGGRNAPVAAIAGTAIGSQVGRCAESGMVARQQAARSAPMGQPQPAWIEVINGRQHVCQNVQVAVTMPTGHVLHETRTQCSGISAQVLTNHR